MLEALTGLLGIAAALAKWYFDPDRIRDKAIADTEEELRQALKGNDMERLTELVSQVLDRSRRARK